MPEPQVIKKKGGISAKMPLDHLSSFIRMVILG